MGAIKIKENNYAFIDSQNLNLAIRDQGGQLDFGRFRIYLRDRYGVTKAFLFIGYVPTNEDLYTSLQTQGFLLVFKPALPLNKNKGVKIKGNADAELVLHTIIRNSGVHNYKIDRVLVPICGPR